MATTTQTKMTIEEFLALPEDENVRRELIRGELREYPMTTRNAKHAHAIVRIAQNLANWLDQQPKLTGVVVAGDARCQLFHDRETVVGIDVGVFLGEEALEAVERGGSFTGPPVLAVEVLSLSDRQWSIYSLVSGRRWCRHLHRTRTCARSSPWQALTSESSSNSPPPKA
jgi:Uma2 family endonuclease